MKRLLCMVLLTACSGDDGGAMVLPIDGGAAGPDTPPSSTTTSLEITLMTTRVLDTAYYGVNADSTPYVEVYKGAAPGCPQMDSPTPDYTFIFGRVNIENMASPGNFLDYVGDMIPNNMPLLAASTVSLANIVFVPDTSIAFDVIATFPDGNAAGHVYATHCASLDG